MSQRLFRAMVVGGVLAWLQVGMSLSRVLALVDAGSAPALSDLLVLALWTISGVLDAVALLRLPIVDHNGDSGAPAA